MPVTGEYTWEETDDHIIVLIPLKGVSPQKVDVFTASTILKVAYSPFLVNLDLYGEIEYEKCKAILKEGTLKVLLAKKDDRRTLWGQLCFDGTKEEVKLRREKALCEREEKTARHIERAATKKVEEERMVFQEHMALEQRERKRMEDAKEEEKRNAEKLLYKTFSSSTSSTQTAKSTSKSVKISKELNMIGTKVYLGDDGVERVRDECDDLPTRPISRVTFLHTPRIFKTPSRESTAKKEQEFILKNKATLKRHALFNASTSICDVDPMWLKTKGDEFMNQGNYSSAINAYSDALEADGTIVGALGSRAACYLHLRQGKCCIEDCLDALSMKEASESYFHSAEEQRQFEKESFVRLGMAYCLNKEYTKGMKSFVQAKKIKESWKPDDIAEQCINYLAVLMEAKHWKDEADRLFAEGKFSDAIDSYTKAFDIDPLFVSSLINRTACHLAMKNSTRCIQDSMDALQLLSLRRHSEYPVLASLLGPNSQTKQKWIVTLLCRLSSARRLKKDLAGSLIDLEEALKNARQINDTESIAIEKDIKVLKVELATLQTKS
ncbi:hypothetical protein HJC23_008595 [Cyclotella cryptica]|uniref:CS domain-containing protein n=1 Tax=Cyclotella cryptica TaxID=29204 RepID=A0ABD3QDQ6_9STRA